MIFAPYRPGMPEPQTVAIVLNDNGSVVDHCWYSYETGQTYSNHGYRVVAVAPILSRRDGSVYMTMADAQALYDHERELAADCFGPGIRNQEAA